MTLQLTVLIQLHETQEVNQGPLVQAGRVETVMPATLQPEASDLIELGRAKLRTMVADAEASAQEQMAQVVENFDSQQQ